MSAFTFGQERAATSAPVGASGDLKSTINELRAQVRHLQLALERLAFRTGINAGGDDGGTPSPDPEIRLREARGAYDEGERAEREGHCAESVSHYSKAILLDPANDSAYLRRSACLLDLGEPLLAIDDLNEALRLQPDDADAYELRGAANSAAGRYARAIADLNEAIRRRPSMPGNFLERAGAYRKSEDLERSLSDYSRALTLAPSGGTYVDRAHVYLALGRNDAALDDCKRALKMDGKLEKAYVCQALALIALGRPDDAATDLQDVLSLRPGFGEVRTLLDLARVLPALRTPRLAGDSTPGRSIPAPATPQREAFALMLKARYLVEHGNCQAALELFERAIGLDPRQPIAYNSRGYAYLRLGDYSRAIEDFQSALRLNPGYGNARVNLKVASKLDPASALPRP